MDNEVSRNLQRFKEQQFKQGLAQGLELLCEQISADAAKNVASKTRGYGDGTLAASITYEQIVSEIKQNMYNPRELALRINGLLDKENNVLVLKDATSIVLNSKEIYVNTSGNNGLATGGSGDILSGIIAGLLAQGLNNIEAASLGVYIHGMAAEHYVDKANCYSKAYDIVINGYEAGGGSIRIHNQDIQSKVFEALGFTEKEIEEKFGFFVDALKYGTPPHGGMAFGLDRLTMLIAETENIRDVIAFPKTASASCLMSEAPNIVSENQLKELHIKLDK